MDTPKAQIEIVCGTCGLSWADHEALVEFEEGERPTLMHCIMLLLQANQGPPGPQGPMGPMGTIQIDPSRTDDPPEALRAFLIWLGARGYLSESAAAAGSAGILGRYWANP